MAPIEELQHSFAHFWNKQLTNPKVFSSKLSFTKWRGRNFEGFVEFPSFPVTYMQKDKKQNLPMAVRWFIFVCVSVRPCVPLKKCCNFWLIGRIGAKFSGPTYLLVSYFWAGDSDPAALGVRLGPRKRGFLPNLSPPGVLGQGGCVAPFRNWDNEANKTLGAEFWYSSHGWRKWSRKAGLARGADQILEFWHFL